ncbi:MAG TPA: two-component regulator propeller domain-containing protein [Bacteroidales bacterium]|nr:two-component regulator propeller domain-containing protein [Bacteroidales bacterium]HSA43739.1 two-component regulator propeller domain-containing protein [Bacteroidales bacterium]
MRKLTVLLVFLCLSAAGQPVLYPLWKVRNYSVNNGLTQNTVYCIYQDKEGFIWAGTGDGLNLLKGQDIMTFRHDPSDPSSLANNVVRGIMEDTRGNLYIGTENGMSVYTPGKGFFNPPLLRDKSVLPVHIEENGLLLWLQCRGLFWYYPADGSLESMDTAFSAFCTRTCTGLTDFTVLKPSADIILNTDQGFFHFKPGEKAVVMPYPLLNELGIRAVYQDNDLTTWLFGKQACYRMSTKEKATVFSRYPPELDDPQIKSVLSPGADIFLIGTYGKGLWTMHRRERKFRQVIREGINFTKRASDLITSLYSDRNRNIWTGTDGNGVEIYRPEENLFLHIHTIPWTHFDLGSEFCKSFASLNDSLLLVSCFNTTLRVFDMHHCRLIPVSTSETSGFSPMVVHAMQRKGPYILFASERGLWQATFRVTATGVAIQEFRCLSVKESRTLVSLNETAYLCNSGNDLLTVRYTSSGFRLTGEKQVWRSAMLCPAAGSGGKQLYIRLNNSILKYHWPGMKPVTEKQSLRLPSEVRKVFFMKSLHPRLLLIGTNNGIYIYQDDSVLYRHYHSGNGLSNNYVYAALPDKSGRLWCSSNGGISCIYLNNNKIRNFGTYHGVQSPEFNSNAYLQAADGSFVFGGIQGFNLFIPDFVLSQKPSLQLSLSAVTVNETLLDPGLITRKGRNNYRHQQNNWWFRVTSLDYPPLRARNYAFRLDGLKDEWIYTGEQNTIRFLQLPPGSYRLWVKLSEPGNEYSEAVELAHFRILRPFYRTWWFLLLTSVLLMAIVYIIVRTYLKAKYQERILLLEKERAVQEERLRISKDMHDDIGTGISQIAVLTEIVKKTVDEPARFMPVVGKISMVAGELIDNISNMIWITKPEYDNLKSLIYYMREYAGSLLENTGISLRFETPGQLPSITVNNQHRKDTFLIYKESLNNILKHAGASKVEIEARYQGNQFELRVTDDGCGFDPSSVEIFSEGLGNIRKRAMDCGGRVSIVSAPGSGTTIHFSCPL